MTLLLRLPTPSLFFFFNDTATTEIYTLSLHDALPIRRGSALLPAGQLRLAAEPGLRRAEPVRRCAGLAVPHLRQPGHRHSWCPEPGRQPVGLVLRAPSGRWPRRRLAGVDSIEASG